VYDDPRDGFTATFLGDARLFAGVVETGGLRLSDGTLIPGVSTPTIAVRPENFHLSQSEPATPFHLRATLSQKIFGGALGTCLLDWQGEVIKAVGRDSDFRNLPEGGPVWVSWEPGHAMPIAG
ncbi:MAG: TOBE domain-containing protein, partial [Rhodobacteraceae bacterium]|nr:TOBE domain-containing protein [Paracoccaceae bacterium]